MASVNENQPAGESVEDRLVPSDNNAVADENGVPQEVDVSVYYIIIHRHYDDDVNPL